MPNRPRSTTESVRLAAKAELKRQANLADLADQVVRGPSSAYVTATEDAKIRAEQALEMLKNPRLDPNTGKVGHYDINAVHDLNSRSSQMNTFDVDQLGEQEMSQQMAKGASTPPGHPRSLSSRYKVSPAAKRDAWRESMPKNLRTAAQEEYAASLNIPAPTPEVDLHSPDPTNGRVHVDPNADTRILAEEPTTEVFSYGEPKRNLYGNSKVDPNAETRVFTEDDLARANVPQRKRLTDKEARAQLTKAERSAAVKGKPLRASVEEMWNTVKPATQLASEEAERILGHRLMPAPETGTAAVGPIQEIVDRRGADIGRAAGERRAASGNSVSTSTSTATIGDSLEDLAARKFQSTAPNVDVGRLAADYTRDTYQSTVAPEPEVNGAIRKSGPRDVEASMLGERVNPRPPLTRESQNAVTAKPAVATAVGSAGSFTERMGAALGARQYGQAAKVAAKGGGSLLLDTAKGLAKPAIETVKNIQAGQAATKASLGALAEKGFIRRFAQGGLIRTLGAARTGAALAGGAAGYAKMGAKGLADLAAFEYVARKGQESTTARQNVAPAFREALAEQQRQGAKYGLDVSSVRSNSSDATLQFKALVGADPKIEVKDNVPLRARFEAANRKRIRGLVARGVVTPIATGRPTIRGTSE